VRLAARLTGWKIDIKNSTEYDQAAEDAVVAELISQREEEEALQQEAEERLAVEQAARAEEDARLRELYPLPEDDEDYVDEAELSDEPSAEFVEGDAVEAVVEEGEGEEAASDSEETGEASADAEVNLSEDAR
jgi:N utilization substance protein A